MDVEAAGVLVILQIDEDVQKVAQLMAVSGMSSAAAPVAPNDGGDDFLRSDPTTFRRRLREL